MSSINSVFQTWEDVQLLLCDQTCLCVVLANQAELQKRLSLSFVKVIYSLKKRKRKKDKKKELRDYSLPNALNIILGEENGFIVFPLRL